MSSKTENTSSSPANQEDIGSECAVQTLYEGPSKCECCKNWVETYPDDLRSSIEEQVQIKQKALVVRLRRGHGDAKALTLDSIVVQSSSLKATLGRVFEGYRGVTPALKKLVFQYPFRPFFYRWSRLEQILREQKLEDPGGAGFTQLLYDVLHRELRDTMAERDDLLANNVITSALLWTLFEPGTRVIAGVAEGSPRIAIAVSCSLDHMAGRWKIQCVGVDYDGKQFGYAKACFEMANFDGTMDILELGVLPARLHPARDEAEARALDRGRRFVQLAGVHYRAYCGLVALPRGYDRRKDTIKINERIMIDAASHSANCSGDSRLEALDSDRLAPELEIKDRRHGMHDSEDEYENTTMPSRPHPRGSMIEDGGSLKKKGDTNDKMTRLTDEQLMLCNSQVRGFSLKHKKWTEFDVDNVTDIAWNDDAFLNLILPDGYKDLILSFIEGQASHGDVFDDIIQGKGLGLILLLIGRPGTGKTLTAEAVADRARKPLYALSADELGEVAPRVELQLTRIMQLTERWNAVLLFDECEVFLQERSAEHLGRNEVVAVFLRVLEYFRGILLMTSNRADSIDRAFQSRIHLTLHYPDLDAAAREHIWRQFRARLPLQERSLSSVDYTRLATLPVNGREIKNILKSATLLAMQQKKQLGMEQIEVVLKAAGIKEGASTI